MKLKTRKSALKRVKKKKNYLARKKAYRGHLLRRKNSKQLRRLSLNANIHSFDLLAFRKMLSY